MEEYYALFVGSMEDEALAYAFALIGFDFRIVGKDEEVPRVLEEILEKNAERYALIILPERFVNATRYLREKLREKAKMLPAFLFIPQTRQPKFNQLKELEELLQRALGISLKLVEE